MTAKDIVTAYKVAVPGKQTQDLPGLDKNILVSSIQHRSTGTTRASLTFKSMSGVEN